MATVNQLDTSVIPNRIWFVNNSDGSVDSTWASRRLARSRKRAMNNDGTTISFSTVTISAPVTDSHS